MILIVLLLISFHAY
ncbi:type I toxin-antitoxin system Ibs family toxin [Escherichia albertii]|nr:type I toxin-antitoxin system Ibs family toxin [Escherichia albertii]